MPEPPVQPAVSDDTIEMRLYGPPITPGVAGEALAAMDGLLREITRALTGSPTAIRWEFGGWRVECDGCGAGRAREHAGWRNDGRCDLCPSCVANQGAGS